MDSDFWLGELARVFLRATEGINDGSLMAIEPIVSDFNDLLEQLKDEYPDNEIIERIDPIEPIEKGSSGRSGNVVSFSASKRTMKPLHEVRSACERIANSINYDLPEFDHYSGTAQNMIHVEVNAEQSQTVEQHITVEQIQETIQHVQRPPKQKQELQELFEEFEEELQGEQDAARLRQILSKVGDISKDVAAQMATRALTYGITGILSLTG